MRFCGPGATPPSAEVFLSELGKRRGCLRAGGVVDLDMAAQILVREFRSGAIGRVTLELP